MKVSLCMASFLPGELPPPCFSPTERGPYRVPYHRSHRPRDQSVVSSLHFMNDPQPEGHMASYLGRRKFLATLLGGAAAWPLAARAQQSAIPVVGVLYGVSAADRTEHMTAVRRGLSETGFVEGRNVAIEYRWAEGQLDRMAWMAADLIGRRVAVILIGGNRTGVRAMIAANQSIPIGLTTGLGPLSA